MLGWTCSWNSPSSTGRIDWVYTTTSSMMETSGSLTFATQAETTVMAWIRQVRPRRWLRLLGPVAGPLGRRMERKIWSGLKYKLEDEACAC